MSKRKHISWKTKCAAALLFSSYPRSYSDAKKMTEDKFLSQFEFDHNMLVESGHEDCDKFWNLTPLLKKVHREKTKQDAKIIAKGRRIRKKNAAARAPTLRIGPDETATSARGAIAEASRPARTDLEDVVSPTYWDIAMREQKKRKLRSRGFDKTLRKKMDGTVVKR